MTTQTAPTRLYTLDELLRNRTVDANDHAYKEPIAQTTVQESPKVSAISSWKELAWPHYVVLVMAVLGFVVLIRTLRTRKLASAVPARSAAPAGDSKMNDRQRMILIATATLIGLMLLFPPFQFRDLGLGYSWLFSPPRQFASINATQLLVQWVAVLLIGGIAFALSGGTHVATPTTAATPSILAPITVTSTALPVAADSGLAHLYGTVIGEKNRAYYLTKFEAFDQSVPGLRPSWNWAAFFVGGVWALYRKMYGWFFAFWGIEFIAQIAFMVFSKLGSPGVGALLFFLPWLVFSVYANALYHRNVKKKITAAQHSAKDEAGLKEHLQRKGGVHTWVIWLFGLVPLIGIILAAAVPMLSRQ